MLLINGYCTLLKNKNEFYLVNFCGVGDKNFPDKPKKKFTRRRNLPTLEQRALSDDVLRPVRIKAPRRVAAQMDVISTRGAF